jgi:hypothetical protein
MGIPIPRFPIMIYDICIQCDIRYTYSFGQKNTRYVHTIYFSYTICVSWINICSDVRFTNLKLRQVALFIQWMKLALCNTIFCLVTNFKILLHVQYLQKYPFPKSHNFYYSLQIQDMSIFKICRQLCFKQACFNMSNLYQCLA